MADETIELTEVQAILDGLSSPTDEQFIQAVREYSDGALAGAAALLAMAGGGGGGGSLPGWWTVDSTPGAESVEMAGQLVIAPNEAQNALVLNPSVDEFDDVFLINTGDTGDISGDGYVLRVHDLASGIDKASIDYDGHLSLRGPFAMMEVLVSDKPSFSVDPRSGTSTVRLEGGLGTFWKLTADNQQFMGGGTPPDDTNISATQVAFWYDDTNGAAKLKFRGRTADDTLVSGEIALT